MFVSSRTHRAFSAVGLFAIVAAVVLVRTRPTHVEHVARLYPGPVPLDLVGNPELPEFVRRNHPPTSNTTFCDGRLFSTTRSSVTGELSTIGVLGMVFDVRSDFERAADERAFDEARRRTLPDPAATVGRRLFAS
jgi:hypothetical protein